MVKDLIRQLEDPDCRGSVASNDTVSAPARLQAIGQLKDESKVSPVSRSQSDLSMQERFASTSADSSPLARRPLAGSSKKVLVDRISLLQNQIITLQQRIADLSRNTSSPLRPKSNKIDESGDEVDEKEEEISTSSVQRRELQLAGMSSHRASEQVVMFPSTFASSSYDDPHNTESEYLEQVVTLAGKLRQGLLRSAAGNTSKVTGEGSERGERGIHETEGIESDDPAAYGTNELRQMLLEATPQPENANSYANAFAKRNLELYKDPKDRSEMMRPGPLQEQTQHPRYVDILTRCIRETYIAHMGTFDELEFCVWLVTEVTYHTEQTGSDEDDLDELDDTRYEFSEKFMKRYPFVGTAQLIRHANIWRHKRGEAPIEQTVEMANAARFTAAQQEMSRDGSYPYTANS